MRKKIGIILFFILFFFFHISDIYAQASNIGFVSGNIWYSKDPFEEGDKIKIYTFIFNPDTRQLNGTVVFFDKTVLLGKKDFTIPPKGANDVFIDWTVTAGDHTIFGKIENAKFLISSGKYEDVYLSDNETEKSTRTVQKKIISKTSSSDDSNSNLTNSNFISSTFQDLTKTIEEKTPEFVSKPIVSGADSLEDFRTNANISSESKKEEVKKEIKNLENDSKEKKLKNNKETQPSSVLKPFKYVELFFFEVISMILGNKILFYGILAIIVFFILRYIWHKIF